MTETIEEKLEGKKLLPPQIVFSDFLSSVLIELTDRQKMEFPMDRRKWHVAFYIAIKNGVLPNYKTRVAIYPYIPNLEEGVYRLMQAGHVLQKCADDKFKYSVPGVDMLKTRQTQFNEEQQTQLKEAAKYICDRILADKLSPSSELGAQ